MRQAPFDREQQKIQLAAFSANLPSEAHSVCWIEGPSGAGKTILLEFATDLLADRIITNSFGERITKCQEASSANEFYFISLILASFQEHSPRAFNAIARKYFYRLEAFPLLEALAALLPIVRGFSWVERLTALKAKKLEKSQTEIQKHLIGSQLINVYSKLIADIVAVLYEKTGRCLLVIDDVCWIDHSSLRILQLAANVLKSRSIPLHFLLSSRSYHSLENPRNAITVTDTFRTISTAFESIFVNNFSFNLTQQFIERERPELSRIAQNIFDITNGNLQDLCQLLRMPLEDVERLHQPGDDAAGLSPPPVSELIEFQASRAHLQSILSENRIAPYVLLAIVIMGNELTRDQCSFLVQGLTRRFERISTSSEDILTLIARLADPTVNILEAAGDRIRLSHDSTSALVRSVANNDGLYTDAKRAVLSLLCEAPSAPQVFGWPEALVRALQLSLTTDVEYGASRFLAVYPEVRTDSSARLPVAQYGAELLLRVPPGLVAEGIVVALACFHDLVAGGRQGAAAALGCRLYSVLDDVPVADRFGFLYRLSVALREIDRFDGSAPTARDAIERALDAAAPNSIEEIRANTIYCSILEHYREHGRIKEIYRQNSNRLETLPDSHEKLVEVIRHVRNLGLVNDHEHNLDHYRDAARLSKRLDKLDLDERLIGASVLNNLGLGLLRAGFADDAASKFRDAMTIMSEVYYPAETPLNNLALCHAMTGDWSGALEYAERAKEAVRNSPYRELSIDINLGIILWHVGREGEAMAIIRQVVGLEPSGRKTFNDELRIRSYMNLGYFLLQRKQYRDAAAAYRKSMEIEIRLATRREFRRRDAMYRLCLARLKDTHAHELDILDDVDIFGTDQSTVSKPYDMQHLALYYN